MKLTLDDTHEALASMLRADKFEPFIRYIRFPHFRNLRDGLRIDFAHPITALVGPNGTNKTAILRALQGCPDKTNVGLYWFSTNLDPILPEDRHRFIHGYVAQSSGQIVEVVKSRIARAGDPDYFEPARPILQDGMARMPAVPKDTPLPPERTATRWKAISKEVVYLDFRSELSAYDKYFFHVPYRRKNASLAAKKDHIRRRAVHLTESLSQKRKSHSFYQSERIIRAASTLSQEQVHAISEILGRRYDSIEVISHRYFDVDGATVVMKSHGLRYSEAFAGSGEFAIVVLVKAISEAADGSLILLDEPEVSLHPGAQRKLMAFIASQAKVHRHQVVISTHSAEIIRDLPPQSIKILHRSETDGKVELVSQESEPSEAFFRLGIDTHEYWQVFVEDGLATALVKRAIRPLGAAANARLRIDFLPGGANTIQQQFIPNFALSGRTRCLVLLDGDQRPDEEIPPAAEVSDATLDSAVLKALKGKIKLPLDGSNGVSAPGQREAQLRRVLEWVHANVGFLPGSDPESLLLEMEGSTAKGDAGKAKAEWAARTRKSLGREDWEEVNSIEILAEQERALARVDATSPQLTEIRERVKRFLSEPD